MTAQDGAGSIGAARIARWTVFLAALALTLATLATHEAYVLRPRDPMLAHLAPFRPWLIPHIAGGVIALVLAPFQFSASLRRARPAVHRWMGRVYVAAALMSSVLSVYIVARFEAPANWWSMGAMGGLWGMCTLFAWLAAMNRSVLQHQLWMGRSVGLTFTFVATRFVPDVLLPGLDYVNMTALYWGFIIAALLIPDLVMNGRALVPWARRR
jgi:hypothetical protein